MVLMKLALITGMHGQLNPSIEAAVKPYEFLSFEQKFDFRGLGQSDRADITFDLAASYKNMGLKVGNKMLIRTFQEARDFPFIELSYTKEL